MIWADAIKVLGGTALAGILALIGKAMGWIRFSGKDRADTQKVQSEINLDHAEVHNKKIDEEIKISKAALEWTVQLAAQLEKANLLNEKRIIEIDRLKDVIFKMREDFDKRIDAVTAILAEAQKALAEEKVLSMELLNELKKLRK